MNGIAITSVFNELSLRNERTLAKVFWIFTCAVLTAVGAQIEIPHQPVPFTLQTFFVLLTGAFLGKRSGAISMVLYLMLGLIGLPVFSGGACGLGKIIGPTGGYLLAFPFAAFVIGYLIEIRKEYWWIVISIVTGSLLIFSLGTLQLNYIYFHDWSRSFQSGFLIFSLWDIAKIVAASTLVHYYYKK